MSKRVAAETTDSAERASFVVTEPERLVLGDLIYVTVQPDVVLRNNETGQPFVPGESTPQRVTPTTIRRLRDGDLQQVAAPASAQ